MARRRKQSLVAGKSINDLMSIDLQSFLRMNDKELRQIVGRMASAGNKRIKSFKDADISTPATRYISRSGGKLSTKGKDINQLRAEYIRAKNFLKAKTSTKRGWAKVQKETEKTLKEQHGIKITQKIFDDFWTAYEDLKEVSPNVRNRSMKYTVLKNIADQIIEGRDVDTIVQDIQDNLATIYEQNEELENETNGVADFFELW